MVTSRRLSDIIRKARGAVADAQTMSPGVHKLEIYDQAAEVIAKKLKEDGVKVVTYKEVTITPIHRYFLARIEEIGIEVRDEREPY